MGTRRRRKKPAAEPQDDHPVIDASGDDPEVDASGGDDDGDSSSPGPVDAPRYSTAWGGVVKSSLAIKDPDAMSRRLRSELELGPEKRSSYAHVLEALDRSARNLDDAHRLCRAAKLEDERYERLAGERIEVLRSAALKELQAEYQNKKRPSPKKDDIEDRLLRDWPVEYRTIRDRIAELHGTVRSLEGLRDAWASRCADLRIMADKAARAPRHRE